MDSIGIDSPWRPGSFSRSELKTRISKDEVYLIMFNDEPVRTATLQEKDEEYWGQMPNDTVYIHKFVLNRQFA